jgi:hypothetical protein
MINFTFSINGRNVDPKNMQDALMAALLESVRAEITDRVGAIRDPDTGEFPTVVVRGDNVDNLSIQVEGSPAVVALVQERLGITAGTDETQDAHVSGAPPKVFLSFAFEDRSLAESLAHALQANGIETWWAEWCMRPGDSLRQKIDEGILECTHFLVLLTPTSIKKPWVNLEMDAGLVRKLGDQCRFLPVRHGLPASELPPLLSGMLSPTVTTDDEIAQLIRDIHEVSRKPPLGAPPTAVAKTAGTETGYSSAATAIARIFVERSENALFADPQFGIEELAREAGLSLNDTKDALFELSVFFRDHHDYAMPEGTLFADFDRYWKPWNAPGDALRLAADVLNDPKFPSDPKQIIERYGWTPRRLNPALYYLLERKLIREIGRAHV